jgi:hypothetical protein
MVVLEVMEVGSSRVLHGLVAVAALSDNLPITVPLFQSLAPHAAAPTLTLTRHPWVAPQSKTVFFIRHGESKWNEAQV